MEGLGRALARSTTAVDDAAPGSGGTDPSLVVRPVQWVRGDALRFTTKRGRVRG